MRCCDCKRIIEDSCGFLHPFMKKPACKKCAGRQCERCGKWVHVRLAVLLGHKNYCLACNKEIR